ncbi:MAG: SPOR domain-containing protein [Gammaproteobacteria bacterium]
MRFVLVFILLLLNASYFAWQFYGAQAPARRWPATDPGIPELQLGNISRPTAIPTSAPRSTVAHPPRHTPARPAAATASPQKKEPDSDPEPAGTPAPPPAQVADASPPKPAPPAQMADASPPKPAPPAQVAEAPPPKPKPPAPACDWLGPYTARDAAEAAARRLANTRPGSRVQESNHTQDRYWVLLPPLPTYDAAAKVIADLKARGIKDIQLLGGDSRDNGISLGVFTQRDTAERRLKQISALGYTPEMQTLPKTVRRYWAVYPGTTPLSEDVRRALLSDSPGLRIERRACP